MAAPRKFAHIVYKTHHLNEMIDWYQYVLECKIQHRDENIAFLTYDEEHHRIAFVNLGPSENGKTGLAEIGPSIGRPGVGVHHVAYTWDTLKDLLDVYKHAKARGILPVANIRHGLTLSMYYADPDGNSMEFQVDVLSLEDAGEFMSGPAFAANPIGEEFDPEEIITGFDAHKPIEELVLRSDQISPKGGLLVTAD